LTEFKNIPIEKISPHPQNPRIFMRDDVVEAIASGIKNRGGFGHEHAILVRPVGDGFEIAAGHHRFEGATKAGLAEIPAWVREMTDDEAYMELALSNSQSQLSNLEKGLHALRYAEKGKVGAGAGNKGGVSEYAKQVNIARGTLDGYINAAEVFENIRICGDLENIRTCGDLMDKTRYLSEIHAAPKEAWAAMVNYLLTEENCTVAKIKTKVKAIKPTCQCNGETKPGVTIDPFSGAGTTGMVCVQHDRDYIGLELSPKYVAMSEKRISAHEFKIKQERLQLELF